MTERINIKDIALNKFKTVGEFAKQMEWSRSKASRILNGIQEPDSEEVELLAKRLEIQSQEEFMQIFFPSMSTKWTKMS